MTNQTKTAIYFFLTFIGLSVGLTSFTTKLIPSVLISLFLAIYFYYDPKKVKERNERLEKKAAEQN